MIEIEGIVAWSGTASVEPAEGLERLDLAVGSLRRSAAFYRRVFGFRPRGGDGSSGSLAIAAGAAILMLHERGQTHLESRHGLRRWAFVVADLDRVRQAVWELGVDVARDSGEPDHIYRWPTRRTLYIRDPDGNDIELLEFVSDAPYLQHTMSAGAASRDDPSRDMLRSVLGDEVYCATNRRY